ncbi:MAG: Kdo hydroxylase family protein, partial [Acidobacteriaceae bacterium]
ARLTARAIGLGRAIPSLKRSPYDDFMMRFHNFLKENPRFQAHCPKYSFQFPSGSSWMVYTDTVPHAVLAGQYALEQTFLVRPEAMVRPEISPLRILEDIAHAPLV